MANSQDSVNNIFRDWVFPALGILIAIGSFFYHQNFLYAILFLIIVFVAFIFGHKHGYRFLSYPSKLKYISSVTEHVFKQVKKKDCVSDKYDKEITELLTILPQYSPEYLYSSHDNLKEKELCRTSIACTEGYKKVHNLKEIAMLFPIFAKLNYNRQWLMPVFGTKDMDNLILINEFTRLTLKYWDNFVVNKDTGKLKDTKYLFITWDLTNIEKWGPFTGSEDRGVNWIKGLLELILEKTQEKKLTVDRILILPDDIFSNHNKKKILKSIAENYFFDQSDDIPRNYRISYVLNNDLINLKTHEKEFFKDVCLFSKGEPKENRFKKFPAFDDPDSFFCVQFSNNISLREKNFLYLFASEKPDNNQNDETKNYYNKFVKQIINISRIISNEIKVFKKEVIQ